jgi:hypothetical protein
MPETNIYRVRLQIDHHCCGCGVKLPAGSLAVRAVVIVTVARMAGACGIAWCDACVGRQILGHERIEVRDAEPSMGGG